MTRTVFCNSLAAVALVFFASTAKAGDAPVQPSESVTKIIVTDPATGTSATATKKPPKAYAGDDPNSASKAKTPKGLTTKKGSQVPTKVAPTSPKVTVEQTTDTRH